MIPQSIFAVRIFPLSSVLEKMAVGYWMAGEEAPLVELGWMAPTGQMYSTTADLNRVRETELCCGMACRECFDLHLVTFLV